MIWMRNSSLLFFRVKFFLIIYVELFHGRRKEKPFLNLWFPQLCGKSLVLQKQHQMHVPYMSNLHFYSLRSIFKQLTFNKTQFSYCTKRQMFNVGWVFNIPVPYFTTPARWHIRPEHNLWSYVKIIENHNVFCSLC